MFCSILECFLSGLVRVRVRVRIRKNPRAEAASISGNAQSFNTP